MAMILGVVSGLHFVAPDLKPDVTIATAVAMQITYAIVCRIFAAQRSRPPGPWLIAGFFGGIVVFVALLIAGESQTAEGD